MSVRVCVCEREGGGVGRVVPCAGRSASESEGTRHRVRGKDTERQIGMPQDMPSPAA